MVDRLLTSARQDDKTTQISNTLNSLRKREMAPKNTKIITTSFSIALEALHQSS